MARRDSAILATALVSVVFGCTTEGPAPMNNLGGQFFDSPFPSDYRTLENGAPDYTGFPNPSGQALLDSYIEFTSALSGTGTVSPIFFRFNGPIDPHLLPTAELSLGLASTAMIIDVDPLSPNRGQRVPIQWEWQDRSTSHQPANLLAIAPLFGTPLRANTKYAALITTTLAQSDPQTAAAWHRGHENFEHMLDTKETLQEVGVPLESVAIITQFTTQDPVAEMADLAWWAREIAPTPSISQTLEYTGQASEFYRFEGTVDVPLLQQGDKPYSSSGGGFVWEGAGLPEVKEWETISFTLSIPRTEEGMPLSGWPVAIYSHGTGGDHDSCCSVNSRLSPAKVLGERGIAVFGISQPLHDDRGTPSTDEDLHTFNFLNPESARSNFRQGAVDIIYQASLLASQQHIFGTDHGEPEVALDPERIGFIGHSQGGLTGAIAAPFVGDIVDGFVLSGAGGGMSITLTQRKDVMDIEQMVKDLLEFSDNEELTELHPVSGLVQVLTEVTDPMNYSAYWYKQEDWFTPSPVNLLLTEGLHDEQTPFGTSEALSASGGLPILEPVAHVSEAHELLGITSQPLPAANNGYAWDGESVTVGLAQYPDDDHFAIFDNSEAANLYGNFLLSAIFGEAVLGE
jgi:hypothetical protein